MKIKEINGLKIELTNYGIKLITKYNNLYISYEDWDKILNFYKKNSNILKNGIKN